MRWDLFLFLYEYFLVYLISILEIIWQIELAEVLSGDGVAVLVEIGLQELIVRVAADEVNGAEAEHQEAVDRRVNSVEILHELVDATRKSQLFELLVRLLFVIAKPIAKLPDLIAVIVTLFIRTVDEFLVQYIVDIGPNLGDFPDAAAVPAHRTHRAAQKEHLLESNLLNEMCQSSPQPLHVSRRHRRSHHKKSVIAASRSPNSHRHSNDTASLSLYRHDVVLHQR